MSTALTVAIGILVLFFICYVDFKVVEWILKGGLKTVKQRFFLIYLPVALLFILNFVPVFYYGANELTVWCRRFSMIIALIYGFGFSLYYFIGPNISNWPLLIGGAMAAYVGLYALDIAGFRFNLTPSMSKGIYVMQPTAERPERGDLVTFCLESSNPFSAIAKEREYIGPGTCPNGLKPFLKRLAGLTGDMVEVAPDGIILNGSYLSGTSRPEFDSQGRTVPPSLLKDGRIPESQAMVISQQHSGSFDSRHFGLVPYDSLTKVSPVLTEDTSAKGAD